MPNDLANKLGDYSQTRPVAVSSNIDVTVKRIGESVHLVIGNADPIKLRYKEAIGLGERLLHEGHLAHKRRENVEIVFGHHCLIVPGKAAKRIGQRLRDRGFEVKFLVSDSHRLLVER